MHANRVYVRQRTDALVDRPLEDRVRQTLDALASAAVGKVNHDADERAISAYHEAGYAIACVELGVDFLRASIIAGEGYAGDSPVERDKSGVIAPDGASFSAASNGWFRAWLEKLAVIGYAGHASVVTLLGIGDMGDDSANTNGAGKAFDRAWLRVDGDPDHIERCKARAVELITARHAPARAIAAALLKRDRLAADEIRALVRSTFPARWEAR